VGRLAVSLLLGCSISLLRLSAAPQQQSQPHASAAPTEAETGPDAYEQVLDRLFPRPRVVAQRGTILRFWLRFTPGLDPALGTESQINVTLVWNTGAVVEYVWADRRVWDVLSKAQPDDVVSKVAVSRKTIKATPSQVMKWQQGLLQALSGIFSALPGETRKVYETDSATITLDASSYDVWYSQNQMEFHYQATETPDQSAFIKWADSFRSEIITAAKFSK
jgi:hypothetical protein